MSGTAALLTFDGCPYAFGTAGCPASVTSTDSDWSEDWTVLSDFLEPPRGTITERLATIDSQLQTGGFTFFLHDLPADGGEYDGVDRLCSYLFTRRPSALVRSALVSPGFQTGDASFTLANPSDFASGSIRVWVDQECLQVTRSGATCTINDYGYLGSRAAHHQTDDTRGYSPVVWSAFPGIVGRRCVLWIVHDGVATPRWRGRVSGCSLIQDDEGEGSLFEIPCEHVWTAARESPVGIYPATARIVGFPSNATADLAATQNDVLIVRVRQGSLTASTSSGWYDAATIDELLLTMADALRGFMVDAGFSEPAQLWFERDEQQRVRIVLLGPTTEDLFIEAQVNGFSGASLGQVRQFKSERWKDSGSVRRAEVAIDSLPSVWVTGLANSVVSRTLLLDDAHGLPTSSGRTTTTILPSTVVVQRVLRGKVNDDWTIALERFAVTVADSTVSGYVRIEPRRGDLRSFRGIITVDKPVELKACGQVIADHWMYGLRYGLLGTVGSRILRTPADPRDWTWDTTARVIAGTAGPRATTGVRWYFDGTEKLGESLTDLARLNGCSIGVRAGGRLAVVLLRPPLPTDAIAATLTHDDYLELPRYESLPEGVANSAKLESEVLSLTVNQLDSEGTYGVSRQVGLRLIGKSDVAPIHTPSPAALALQLLRFVLGTWSARTELHTLYVSASAFGESVFHGDVVEFDSVVAPDGAGARGVSALRGVVIGKSADPFESDRLMLEVLTFPTKERLRAVSPCVRIASISGDTLTVDTNYLTLSDGATDYAGSNLSGYRKTANDGGAGWFEAGDVCTIRAVNTRSVLEEVGLTIESVSGTTIVLTASIPSTVHDWSAFVAAGGLAELVFIAYDAASERQRSFAYIGNETERLIDGIDPLHNLSP